jgi:simple sugar transport system substrate-binding protein
MKPRLFGRRITTLLAAALLVIAALTSCSSTGGKPTSTGGGMGAGTADTPRKVVAMIGHYGPGVAFADLIRKGAETAAAKDNIELRFSTDPDAPTQANMVQSAIDSKVDGIAVTLAKPDAMAPAVKAAIAAGIPVVGFNAGFTDWQAMGIKEFFGQDETIAGREAGKRLAAEGAKNTLCVIHEQGNVSLEARCAGVKEGLGGGAIENLYVNGNDMTSVASTITAKLQQDPSIDHIATLYSAIGMAALQAKEATGSKATIVTFDTSAELVGAIKDKKIAWTIDQQPVLQGYLAVDSLWLYLNNRNAIGGGAATLTGPAFVDESNIDAIAEYAQRGTR